jgi:hypothetical protein
MEEIDEPALVKMVSPVVSLTCTVKQYSATGAVA